MNNILIYNPKCSKSREALNMIEEKSLGLEVRNYLEKPLSKKELEAVLDKLGVTANDIIRLKEPEYAENHLAEASCEQLIDAIVRFPKLLERPIVIINGKAVVARPPSKIEDIL